MKTFLYSISLALWAGLLLLAASACSALPGNATPTPEPEPEIQGPPIVAATGIVLPVNFSSLSPKTAGVAEAVLVNENDEVQAGQVLLRLEGSENQEAAIAAAKLELAAAQVALDGLNKDSDLRLAAAYQALAQARKALQDAERHRRNLELPAGKSDIDQARANLAILKDRLEDAIEDYEPYEKKPEDNPVRAAYLSRKAQAEKDYETAVRRLNNLLEGASSMDIDLAEADLQSAKAELDKAQRDYDTYLRGPDPDDQRVAEERLANARVQLEATQAALLDLELLAPFAGTVSELNIHPGEWVNPGQPVLILADLKHLQVETTDLNEIDMARVAVGYPASVSFDALPDLVVRGKVTRIAVKSSAGSGVNYTVIVELDAIPARLRWGMTAFVDIEVEE
jgi:multidrug efflux pump subunit AcrA (membrane-fusion protein)